MEKINFKWGLFLGALILANTFFFIIHIRMIAFDGAGWVSVINGCIHVLCMFIHAIWVSEVLDQ